jgi:hypothetical protein
VWRQTEVAFLSPRVTRQAFEVSVEVFDGQVRLRLRR